MAKTDFTPEEAAQIAMAFGRKRIAELAKSLKELRERELKKAIVPPHKHSTGLSAGGGTEDIAPAKINPPGKDDMLKEESSGEKSSEESSMSKEELCKKCGKGHMEKGCESMEMDKAMLVDEKGKHVDNGIAPDSKLPGDSKSKKIPAEGSGGMKKEAMSEVKKAVSPPMAKPPSGKNMGTHVPTSMGKDAMPTKPPSPPISAPQSVLPLLREELDKGVMADIAKQNSPPGPEAAVAAPKVKMPTPAEHANRANDFAAFMPKPAQTGHTPKPGIFGRLNKSELVKAVTTSIPSLKAGATGMHTVGGNTVTAPISQEKTGAGIAPKSVTVASEPTKPVAKPMLSNIPRSPVLVKRPGIKPAGAGLKTAGASTENTEGDKTDLAHTKVARPKNIGNK